MDLPYIESAGKLAIIANYLLLAVTYVHGYLRPKESTEWIVVSASSYFLFAFFSVFTMMLAFGAKMIILIAPFAALWLALFLLFMKSRIELMSGRQWAVPLALLMLSVLQEMAAVVMADEVTAALVIFWYILSVPILLAGAILAGPLVDRLNPALSASHLGEMKALFGPDVPKRVVFRNGDVMQANLTPGTALMMGVLYAIWMCLRHLLFP